MGKPPAFQLYASDFDMDTASWDNDEVGIYFRLLMYQWVNGSVPSDLSRLSKIARMSPKKFQNRWKIISGKFKENGNNSLINPRMEKTRKEQDNYKKSQSDAGKRGIEIKRERGIYPFKRPLKRPLKRPCKPKSSSSSSSSPSIKKNIYMSDFLIFYGAYPKHKSKDEAQKAWVKLKKINQLPDMEILLAAIKQQKKTNDWEKENGQFIPLPSTWLNQKRWEDEITIEPEYDPLEGCDN